MAMYEENWSSPSVRGPQSNCSYQPNDARSLASNDFCLDIPFLPPFFNIRNFKKEIQQKNSKTA